MADAAILDTGTAGDVVNLTHLPYEIDDGFGWRARIGVVVLATDHTIESEWKQLLDIDGVQLYHSRIENSSDITPASLKAMEKHITAEATKIKAALPLNAIAYGCTSASMVIGEENVGALLNKAHPDANWTTPITAARLGLQAMGVKRIALLTPYIQEINDMLRSYIEARGIEVPVMGSFNEGNDDKAARITLDAVEDAAVKLGSYDQVDGVFVSCTSIRLAERVEAIEAKLGKPVTSSNHAMAWHALRQAGIDDKLEGRGRLFKV